MEASRDFEDQKHPKAVTHGITDASMDGSTLRKDADGKPLLFGEIRCFPY